nr:WI [Urechis unicinctus]
MRTNRQNYAVWIVVCAATLGTVTVAALTDATRCSSEKKTEGVALTVLLLGHGCDSPLPHTNLSLASHNDHADEPSSILCHAESDEQGYIRLTVAKTELNDLSLCSALDACVSLSEVEPAPSTAEVDMGWLCVEDEPQHRRLRRDLAHELRAVWSAPSPSGMDWPKRSWSNADTEWLKKRSDIGRWRLNSPYDSNKRWNAAPIEWLKRSSPSYGNNVYDELDGEIYDDLHDDDFNEEKRTWYNSNTDWLKKRGWTNADTEWLKKRSWNDNDMPWLKRWAGNSEVMQWLKKRAWDTSSGLNWLKRNPEIRRGWSNANTEWIKRDLDGTPIHHIGKRSVDDDKQVVEVISEEEAKSAIPDTLSLVKRDWNSAGSDWLKQAEEAKRKWVNSGISWIKRDDHETDKRKWGNSGLSWIKRDHPDEEKRKWGNSGLSWIKRGYPEDEKRKWANSGLSWIKRGDPEEEKRKWGKSGLSWIKRNEPEEEKRKWGNSGLTWIKRDNPEEEKRKWGNSGLSWIKRDDHEDEKRKWANSGLSWIKRADPEEEKRKWGNSGLGWIKRDDPEEEKRKWGNSGLSWIKRDDPEEEKRKWANSGLSWIKRGEHDEGKRKWGNSGLSWIKRKWGNSGLSWIKRNPMEVKRKWGNSGLNWIKRDISDFATEEQVPLELGQQKRNLTPNAAQSKQSQGRSGDKPSPKANTKHH